MHGPLRSLHAHALQLILCKQTKVGNNTSLAVALLCVLHTSHLQGMLRLLIHCPSPIPGQCLSPASESEML